ncbi:MAG: tRNA (adenosine(37)-N6)-threonylcarbamoyltransferase complex transferase subunit TsaD, partial [Candidatus Omnitrophica bacterium]|nr:tRNA (adenosine(37)-N6)-threonylcarbamoyltransferase complex transferase subunit TsaD [Candidatus Omnitrophota bacterium]
KILRLGYPGSPVIERKARSGIQHPPLKFPRAFMGKDSLDFSFSGLKTAVFYYVGAKRITPALVSKVAYAFQESVFSVIIRNVIAASKKYGITTVLVGGGVACNKVLSLKLKEASIKEGFSLFMPEPQYALDNGAMVAAIGEELFKRGHRSPLDLTAEPNLEGDIWWNQRSISR